MRVEMTCRTRGPVIRAEAAAADEYAALDLAIGKLDMRLRRAADRRRVHHGSRTPISVAAATSAVAAADAALDGAALAAHDGAGTAAPDGADTATEESADEAPFVVREKRHYAAPMSLDQALFEMELIGHDFFLYVEAETGLPSVVYRRHGYDYGVVRLHEPDAAH
jgi:Sigma 54 modulation/S30EA ribosomal protein C terminus/Sigma 54 modulation protein / S30EA ribosomal protein